MPLCDVHCHFFSSRFLQLLTTGRQELPQEPERVAALLGWDPPGTPEALADAWVAEIDRHGVSRIVLIASVPGDEDSVGIAVARHPSRFVGFFMFNPLAPDSSTRLARALREMKLRGIALFPAMHGYQLDDERVATVFEAAGLAGAAVFAHCGVLTVGVRRKLGLPSPFDLRLGNPLAAARMAARFPQVTVIIPHFGAGFFREALMAADQCANIHLDTSSSNSWVKYHPGLTLDAVFRQALAVAGPDRLIFGTDSSFFPRGWQRAVYDAQTAALDGAGASEAVRAKILAANFERLFPA